MTDINRHLKTMAVSGRIARRTALESILEKENLEYLILSNENTTKTSFWIQDYLMLPQTDKQYPLFCAHYDAAAESTGANDNAAAVCILIELALFCAKKNITAGFAFFDAEEDKQKGAKLFASEYKSLSLQAIVNLDLCGYGDTLAVYPMSSSKDSFAKQFLDKKRLEKHHAKIVKYLPESDNIVFSSRKQPILSLSILPSSDIGYLNALATYKNNFLGKPPEYYDMIGQMEVSSTMHGGTMDSIGYVESSAMLQVFNYLIDVLTAPPLKTNKPFHFFGIKE